MDFGKKLKEIRQQYSLSQLEISERLNIDARQYSKIERGIMLPTLSQIMDIISLFKINSAWLLEDTGKMLKEKLISGFNPETFKVEFSFDDKKK